LFLTEDGISLDEFGKICVEVWTLRK